MTNLNAGGGNVNKVADSSLTLFTVRVVLVPAITGMVAWMLVTMVGVQKDVSAISATLAAGYSRSEANRDFSVRDGRINNLAVDVQNLKDRTAVLETARNRIR